MRATPKTCSPSLTAGPKVTFSSFGSLTFLLDCTTTKVKAKNPIRIAILHSQTNHRVLNFLLKENLWCNYIRLSDLRTMMNSQVSQLLLQTRKWWQSQGLGDNPQPVLFCPWTWAAWAYNATKKFGPVYQETLFIPIFQTHSFYVFNA